ncbi:MAG: hypothetical protein H7X99_08040 [Saprospiraceae bacterium]|nr:hypothetical protein [Saprospiraceae bacterium]
MTSFRQIAFVLSDMLKIRKIVIMFRPMILSFFLLMSVIHISAQPLCNGSLIVVILGTSTGFPEGLIVKDSADSGFNTLRNIIACAHDGDVITYDQTAPIPVNTTLLTKPLNIDKSLIFKGLDIDYRPEITVDFATIGIQSGIRITNGKTVTLKNIDLREINNPFKNNLIMVETNSTLDITGKTVLSTD